MLTPLQHPALTPLQIEWQSIAAARRRSAFVGGSLARREAQPMVEEREWAAKHTSSAARCCWR